MKLSADLAPFTALAALYETVIMEPAQRATASYVTEMYSRLSRGTPRVSGETARRWRITGDGAPLSITGVLTTDADVIGVELATPYALKFEDGFGGEGGTEGWHKTRTGSVVRKTRTGNGFVVIRTVAGTARSLQAPDGIVGPLRPVAASLLLAFLRRYA